MRNVLVLGILSVVLFPVYAREEMQFKLHVINDASPYEAAGIGDFNGDSIPDVLCGAYWYAGPDFVPHKIAELKEVNEYYDDFASEILDIDEDGDLDTLSCTWFSQSIFWRENPGGEGEWNVHVVDTPGNMETGFSYDVDQDGRIDFVPNINKEIAWYRNTAPATWEKMTVGVDGAGHGIGVGDVDQNGVTDFVTPRGWYQGSENQDGITFAWNEWDDLGGTSIPMLVHDVNEDGLNDIVYGMGHDFGVFWKEQIIINGKRSWNTHTIDDRWSQAHYMRIVDLNEDGRWELVTGKRHRAHNGKDPGGTDEVCVYLYSYHGESGEWNRQTLSEGGGVGFGLNADIGDMDGDGDFDIVCPGKSGLYWFEQL